MDQPYDIPAITDTAIIAVQPCTHNFYYSGMDGSGVESHADCWINKS
jgi:hypothetical protein